MYVDQEAQQRFSSIKKQKNILDFSSFVVGNSDGENNFLH